MECVCLMARRISITVAEVDGASAALAVERAHTQHQWMGVDIIPDLKRLASEALRHEAVFSGRRECSEVGQGYRVA